MFCVRLSRISVTTGHLTWASETRRVDPGDLAGASETRRVDPEEPTVCPLFASREEMHGRGGTEASVESATATRELRRAPASASGFRASAGALRLLRLELVGLALVGLELEPPLGTLRRSRRTHITCT